MSKRTGIKWSLREVMATRGLFQTTELVPLLDERGVQLSREQVYRLVAKTPQRITVEVLAALCDILDCKPNDLLVLTAEQEAKVRTGTDGGPGIGDLRPIRATIRRPGESG
jgi:DNA-binding Xre family transcriptional regulator